MTVCVAVRCANNIVFGASDRMLTAGDVESNQIPRNYSPDDLNSGNDCRNAAFQAEILRGMFPIISSRIEADPKTWLSVRDMAYLYLRVRTEIKRKRGEETLLVPLGLNQDTFISRQSEMRDSFVTKLTEELVNFKVPQTEAIFAGLDVWGAHLYTVENDDVQCHDTIGFAAIGIGYWHSNSQLMFTCHNYESPMTDGLLLAYLILQKNVLRLLLALVRARICL